MIHTVHVKNINHPPPIPVKKIEMMSVNKFAKISHTNSIGTQTDPVHVSLKSRRGMGFKIHPIDRYVDDMHEYPDGKGWIRDYWIIPT